MHSIIILLEGKMLFSKFVLVNHWLHLSAASLLIGGMVFLVVILRPVLGKKHAISGMVTVVNETHDRFRKYVGILMGVIIFTGIVNFLESTMGDSKTAASLMYIAVIRIKVLLAICLFIIYGINAFLLREPKENIEGCGSCVMQPPTYKRVMQIIALLLAFIILFLATMLRYA